MSNRGNYMSLRFEISVLKQQFNSMSRTELNSKSGREIASRLIKLKNAKNSLDKSIKNNNNG